MTWNKVIIFCCIMLSSNVFTDAYGFAVKGENNSKDTNKKLTDQQHLSQDKIVDKRFNTTKDVSEPKPQVGKRTPLSTSTAEKLTPNERLALEINELNRMHKQLVNERATDPNNTKKLQLQLEIEKQIRIRKQQQQAKKTGDIRHNEPSPSRTLKVLYNPSQTLAAISSKSLLNQGNVQSNNKKESQSLSGNGNKLYNHSNSKAHTRQPKQVHLNSLQKLVLPNTQSQNMQGVKHVFYPHHTINRNPLVHLNNINAAAVQQIPTGHVLVPVNSLSLAGGDLNVHRMPKTYIVMNSEQHGNPGGKSTKKTTNTSTSDSLNRPSSSTLSPATKKNSSTTPLPTTTSASFPTATEIGDFDFTTPVDAETAKKNFMKGRIEKQRLEIRKLKLEIRALVREEKQNLAEFEHEEAARHTHGK